MKFLDFILRKAVYRHPRNQTDQQQYAKASQCFDFKKLQSLYFMFPCMIQHAMKQTACHTPPSHFKRNNFSVLAS